jgi:citrate lyase beta subunit
MKSFRSLLFVPGIRPERFAKAIEAGADCVCIDLEDAVPAHQKAQARDAVKAFLTANSAEKRCDVGVRINALATEDGQQDIKAIAALARGPDFIPDFIMVPKAVSAPDLAALPGALGSPNMPIWAVIESVEGLLCTAPIAKACAPSGGILFGGADFSAEIGTNMAWEPLFYARSKIATEARIAPLNVMDVPFLEVSDTDGLRGECERVAALGYNGKACIHPSQVAIVNAVFSPSTATIDWAKKVTQARQESQGGAVLLDGKLVDAPVYLRAQRILTQAGIEI